MIFHVIFWWIKMIFHGLFGGISDLSILWAVLLSQRILFAGNHIVGIVGDPASHIFVILLVYWFRIIVNFEQMRFGLISFRVIFASIVRRIDFIGSLLVDVCYRRILYQLLTLVVRIRWKLWLSYGIPINNLTFSLNLTWFWTIPELRLWNPSSEFLLIHPRLFLFL